jgi:hypothetical protein
LQRKRNCSERAELVGHGQGVLTLALTLVLPLMAMAPDVGDGGLMVRPAGSSSERL